ncbi:MAG: hypothetical protein QXV17_06820 [Candidatus Micrarchaeaceae archaeon]
MSTDLEKLARKMRVIDNLNAIALHKRIGKLVEQNHLQCDICMRIYAINTFFTHFCIHYRDDEEKMKETISRIMQKTPEGIQTYAGMTIDNELIKWREGKFQQQTITTTKNKNQDTLDAYF